MNAFQSILVKKHARLPARMMRMQTAHGTVTTPAFMPVGTRAVLNYLTPHDLTANGTQIILGGNTYHMLCTPGMAVIEKLGGMHRLMGWPHTMLTDSGGYQVLSLSKGGSICTIDEEGAHFKHPLTHQVIHLNAESAIQTQKIIGADIIMAFDQCTPEKGGYEIAKQAMDRTHRWLARSKIAHDQQPAALYGYPQALFGIIQGGYFRALREISTQFVLSQAVEGIAIGGEVIGFEMEKTCEIIDWIRPLLPEDKIRYTMGVGLSPQDLIDVVAHGVDIFDCVAPTRNARHGALYCGEILEQGDWLTFDNEGDRGRLLIKKSIYAQDQRPIMATCLCYTCQHFSRAYLHYLFKNKLTAYYHLASIHNVQVMQAVCLKMQQIISL